MDLESAARELYAPCCPVSSPPPRNAKAKEAAQDGDKALAARLRSLSKPTAAAWLLNMMARHRRDEIDGVIELGAAMSQAQQELAPGQMRTLGDQRRGLLSAMALSGRQFRPTNWAIRSALPWPAKWSRRCGPRCPTRQRGLRWPAG